MVRGQSAQTYVAFDFGSSSLKVAYANSDNSDRELKYEIVRYPHRPYQNGPYLEWDIEALNEIVSRVLRSLRGTAIITFDFWGSDVVYLDRDMNRIGPARCYRDPGLKKSYRELQMAGFDEILETTTRGSLKSGSTAVQLHAIRSEQNDWISDVSYIVSLVDYLIYLHTGYLGWSVSAASTTGLIFPGKRELAAGLVERLGFDDTLFLKPEIECDLLPLKSEDQGHFVARINGHDTAAALEAGYRALNGFNAFACLGSWSVVGALIPGSCASSAGKMRDLGFSIEVQGDGSLRLVRDVPGLRIIQLLSEIAGERVASTHLSDLRASSNPFGRHPVIAIDDLDFSGQRDVFRWLQDAGSSIGISIKTIFEAEIESLRSIAASIASAVEDLREFEFLSEPFVIWLNGGGVEIPLLSEWIAELSGCEIKTGPSEASAVGSVLGAKQVFNSKWRTG